MRPLGCEPSGPFFEELKRVNPLGQLPTLITPGGEVLTESVAILWTLLERHPSEWVPPLSTRDRAKCLRWMQFAASTVYSAVGVADYPSRWTTASDDAARKAVEEAAVTRMKLGWDIIAAEYKGNDFFLGERPYVCDIYLANLSKWWKMRDSPACRPSGVLRSDGKSRCIAGSGARLAAALVMIALHALRFAAIVGQLLLLAPPALSQVSVTVFGGYAVSEGIENETTGERASVKSGATFGVAADYDLDSARQLQLFYGQQSTSLNPGGGVPRFDIDVRYLHLGGTYFFDGPIGRGPYAVGGSASRISRRT